MNFASNITRNNGISSSAGHNDYRRKNNILKIENTNNEELLTRSSNKIKHFLRKTISSQSYRTMFSDGSNFKTLNIDLPKLSTKKAPLSTLEHLNKVSKYYLKNISDKIPNLTLQERNLLGKIADSNWKFRHQSNSNLAAEHLNIMSLHKLKNSGINTGINTYNDDLECLSNHDFVFFGVEFSSDTQLPLNTKHTTKDFGANAYIIYDEYPDGYLTLTDHFDNIIPPAFTHEHKDFILQFSELKKELHRIVHGDKGRKDVPIFNTKDMKLGLGLHLIEFIRNSKDAAFKAFVLDENLNSVELDRVLNVVFQPEFHIPRMVSTKRFEEIKLREITIEDAMKASNFQVLFSYMQNKEDACSVMEMAIKYNKKDICEYLFSLFTFTSEDVLKMSSYLDIEYILSDFSSSVDILKLFLERKLVDPNKAFERVNSGDTMLDNAIKYAKQDMIDLLLEYDAITGKQKIEQNHLLSLQG